MKGKGWGEENKFLSGEEDGRWFLCSFYTISWKIGCDTEGERLVVEDGDKKNLVLRVYNKGMFFTLSNG